MSLSALERTVANLRACMPAPSSSLLPDKVNQAEELLTLARQYVTAVEEVGLEGEFDRRAALLPALMHELEDARKAANAAVMVRLQPDPKQPPKAAGIFLEDDNGRFFPVLIEPGDVKRFLSNASSVLMHMPRSVQYARTLSLDTR